MHVARTRRHKQQQAGELRLVEILRAYLHRRQELVFRLARQPRVEMPAAERPCRLERSSEAATQADRRYRTDARRRRCRRPSFALIFLRFDIAHRTACARLAAAGTSAEGRNAFVPAAVGRSYSFGVTE